MASQERIRVQDRQPAIPKENLRLPDGQYANKYSLLHILSENGLPVPSIFTSDDLQALNDRFNNAQLQDVRFQSLLDHHPEYVVFMRSFFSDPIDNWSVDTIPTYRIAPPYEQDITVFGADLKEDCRDQNLRVYLKRNFNTKSFPEVKFFLNQNVIYNFYLSFWERGQDIYGVCQYHQGAEGTNWFHFHDNVCIASSDQYGEIVDIATDILPIIHTSSTVLNSAFGKQFEYKYDLLGSLDDYSIIQARVASEVTTSDIQTNQAEKIASLRRGNAPEINVDVGKFAHFCSHIPNKPYIMRLWNRTHVDNWDESHFALDFRNMVGLSLPISLRKGLLQHHGYNVIAYALYWGIPIIFED